MTDEIRRKFYTATRLAAQAWLRPDDHDIRTRIEAMRQTCEILLAELDRAESRELAEVSR